MVMDSEEIVTKLRDLKFIGLFPLGIEVLLVPIDTANKEINSYLDVKLSKSQFLSNLKQEEIFIFSTPEDWLKFKNPEEWAKQYRKKRRAV